MLIMPELGRQRPVGPWGLVASQPSLISAPQGSRRPHLKNQTKLKWMVHKEQYPWLISGLHDIYTGLLYVIMHIHTCVCPHHVGIHKTT